MRGFPARIPPKERLTIHPEGECAAINIDVVGASQDEGSVTLEIDIPKDISYGVTEPKA